nr:uncharacterized protein LOC103247113 isoform X5 [Chlorocebus sabaeus]
MFTRAGFLDRDKDVHTCSADFHSLAMRAFSLTGAPSAISAGSYVDASVTKWKASGPGGACSNQERPESKKHSEQMHDAQGWMAIGSHSVAQAGVNRCSHSSLKPPTPGIRQSSHLNVPRGWDCRPPMQASILGDAPVGETFKKRICLDLQTAPLAPGGSAVQSCSGLSSSILPLSVLGTS